MIIEPNFERLKKALRREEPDRLPLFEGLIAHEIQSRFLGKAVVARDFQAQVEFFVQAGYDFIPLPVGMMNPGELTKESKIFGVVQKVLQKDEETEQIILWNIEEKGVISSPEDYDIFPWDEAAKLDCSNFYNTLPFLPQGMKMVAVSGKIFTLTWMLMGFQNFCLSLYLQEELVKKIFDKVGEIQIQATKKLLEVPGLGGILIADDLAYCSGLMIDPRFIRKYVFPWYEELASICQKYDLLFVFHSDGNIWQIMEDVIAIGFDAINPVDPTSMDIQEVKEKIGHKIGITGNIDTDLLSRGSPDEVRELTKKRIREIAPRGGYALGSGNSVPSWSRFENYQAMRETALTYGTYPIRV